MANWRVILTPAIYVSVEDSKLVVYDEDEKIYFVKDAGTDAAETIATFKMESIIGAYKEDAEISRASEYPRRGRSRPRVHVRKGKDESSDILAIPGDGEA